MRRWKFIKLFIKNAYKNKNIIWHGWLNGKLNNIFANTDFLIMSLNSKGRQGLIIPSKIQTYFMKQNQFCAFPRVLVVI